MLRLRGRLNVSLAVAAIAAVCTALLSLPQVAEAKPDEAERTVALLEPAEGVLFGAWPASGSTNAERASDAVDEFEAFTDTRLDIVHIFEPPHQPAWDLEWANWVLGSGRIPMITWRVGPEGTVSTGDNVGQRVVNGEFDEQIRARALQAKQIDGPFFSRLFHEMDGTTGEVYDLTPEIFGQYWRRVRAIFKEEGVRNASWVWNVAALSPGEEAWYPGDDVVDWLAASPFHWVGEHPDPSKERDGCRTAQPETLSQKIGDTFRQFVAAHPDKPIMLGEWGTGTRTGTSARVDFLNSVAATIDEMPQLKALVYFHSSSGGCGWRLDQGFDTEGAAEAYKDLVTGRQATIDPLLRHYQTRTICNGLPVTVDLAIGERPTKGNDVIVGTEGRDKIKAGGGDDVICALGGNDRVVGGAGADLVLAGPGDDVVLGGKGSDLLEGGSGDDLLEGGKGSDELRGGAGDDQLKGDGGSDRVFGQGGNDTMEGGAGRDLLNGGKGRDSADGGAGKESPPKKDRYGCSAEVVKAC